MERKIGEIFQINGQNIQVVEQTNACACYGCCFGLNGLCFKDKEAGECDYINRVDRKEVIFKYIFTPIKFLVPTRVYKFDFTGKKVKYATDDDDKFSVQSKFDLAWFIDRIDPNMHMVICEDAYKYDEIKRSLLEMLIEKGYSNVQIIK